MDLDPQLLDRLALVFARAAVDRLLADQLEEGPERGLAALGQDEVKLQEEKHGNCTAREVVRKPTVVA
jgi:hypothetical protein